MLRCDKMPMAKRRWRPARGHTGERRFRRDNPPWRRDHRRRAKKQVLKRRRQANKPVANSRRRAWWASTCLAWLQRRPNLPYDEEGEISHRPQRVTASIGSCCRLPSECRLATDGARSRPFCNFPDSAKCRLLNGDAACFNQSLKLRRTHACFSACSTLCQFQYRAGQPRCCLRDDRAQISWE
jgi:hypothetical protein